MPSLPPRAASAARAWLAAGSRSPGQRLIFTLTGVPRRGTLERKTCADVALATHIRGVTRR